MYAFIIIILLFEYSTAVTENCYQSNNITCAGYTESSSVSCYVGHTPNYALVTDALRNCTIGKEYQVAQVYFDVSELSFEFQLELGDNVTEFWMICFYSQQIISISPLKKHLNLTSLGFENAYPNFNSDHFLSINFPNLEVISFYSMYNIETMGNFLAGLKSLYIFVWVRGSLVNISENAFEGLTSLSYIYLISNSISYLPSTLFQGLPSLSEIELSYNSISYLPSTLFQGLSSLSLIGLVGNPLNCSTCRLQWMSIVDSKFGIEIRGNCFDSNEPVGLVSSHSHCSSTESYQCFNKSVSCEQSCINTPSSYICACNEGFYVEGNSCSDIDECTSNPCEYSCNNTVGSYQCLSNRIPSQSVSSLTAFFIAVSGLEALLLVFCSIYVIVTCTLHFSKSKRIAKDRTRSDSLGLHKNENIYDTTENATSI